MYQNGFIQNEMNKRIIIPFITAFFLLSSCQQKPWAEDQFKQTADSVEGYFGLEECIWDGPAVDLNHDGTVSSNIIDEFPPVHDLPMAHVYPLYWNPDFIGNNSHFSLLLPFQKIPVIAGFFPAEPKMEMTRLLTSYTVTQEGQLRFLWPFYFEDKSDGVFYEDCKRFRKDLTVTPLLRGRLEIHLTMTVYDYSSNEWVTAPLTYRLKRLHY